MVGRQGNSIADTERAWLHALCWAGGLILATVHLVQSTTQVYQFEYMKKDPASASAVRLTSGNLVKKVLCAFMRNAGFWVPNGCYIPAAMPAAAASVGSAARSSSGFGRTSSSGSAGAFGSGASSSSQKASDATEASREAFRKQLAQQISELTGVQPRFELEKTATGIEQYRIYRL